MLGIIQRLKHLKALGHYNSVRTVFLLYTVFLGFNTTTNAKLMAKAKVSSKKKAVSKLTKRRHYKEEEQSNLLILNTVRILHFDCNDRVLSILRQPYD